MDQIMVEVKKIPPVTKFLCASSLVVTFGVILHMLHTVAFKPSLTFGRLQLWTLHTSFFLGRPDLYYIVEFFMLYRSANDLESKSYFNRSSDLAWQLFWACWCIILVTMPLKFVFFFWSPLLVCLLYLYSALAPPGTKTSIMGLVTVPILFYPYILIVFALLEKRIRGAALATAGAVVGHAWWWSVWGGGLGSQGILTSWIRAPRWLRKLMREHNLPGAPVAGGSAAALERAGIHVTAPRDRAQPAGGTSGHNWGSGRTLGSAR
ncbi:hypothetical protein CPC08DRAFT_628402 [Agrocybe pediades]|nr:hypothetical protein CPC08DRAFT_628402 [Agrocybe pediades]